MLIAWHANRFTWIFSSPWSNDAVRRSPSTRVDYNARIFFNCKSSFVQSKWQRAFSLGILVSFYLLFARHRFEIEKKRKNKTIIIMSSHESVYLTSSYTDPCLLADEPWPCEWNQPFFKPTKHNRTIWKNSYSTTRKIQNKISISCSFRVFLFFLSVRDGV